MIFTGILSKTYLVYGVGMTDVEFRTLFINNIKQNMTIFTESKSLQPW